MSQALNVIGKFGPLNVELVNSEAFDFYRFFFRRNNDNDNIYSISTDFVEMKHLDLENKTYRNYKALYNYLNSITANNNNVEDNDIERIKNDIINNFTNEYSCLEVILPIKDGNKYSQSDIDELYDAIFNALQTINMI